jgi:hypothetical protein
MNAVEKDVLELLRAGAEPMGTAGLFPLCESAATALDVSRALHALREAGLIKVAGHLARVGRGSPAKLYAPVEGAVPPVDGRRKAKGQVQEEAVQLDPFEAGAVATPAPAPAAAPAPKPKAKRATKVAPKPEAPTPVVTHAAPCPPPWPGALDISASLFDAATAATDALLSYADAMLGQDPRWWSLRQLQRAATSAQQEMGVRD